MQPDLPLISVVLCTFNGEKYVAEQLRSILNQQYANMEVIICDDASTDHTPFLLKQFAENDKRISLHINPKNLGYNKNFEQAVQLASGNWIAIADQDDIWLPQKLMRLYRGADDEIMLVHSYNAEFKNDDTSVTFINRSRIRFSGSNIRELVFYNTISGHAMMFRKSLLAVALPFPEGVYYDWWIGLNASIQGKVGLVDEALVLHRQHSSNFSHISQQLSPEEIKKKFFKERVATLEHFTKLSGLPKTDKDLLNDYIKLLRTEWRKNFSLPVFLFFMKHAKAAFYYRKKKPMAFYYVKYSLKRASMKVKNWT